MHYPNQNNHFHLEQALLLKNSYRQLLSKDLMPDTQADEAFAEQLFLAPFAVVSHNTASDPFFNYANLKALELFELSWDALIQLPSRCSAEPINQAEREHLLSEVTAKGYIDHYQGIRISSTGRRFMIKNAVVWNLIDDKGENKGQAACFEDWDFL